MRGYTRSVWLKNANAKSVGATSSGAIAHGILSQCLRNNPPAEPCRLGSDERRFPAPFRSHAMGLQGRAKTLLFETPAGSRNLNENRDMIFRRIAITMMAEHKAHCIRRRSDE